MISKLIKWCSHYAYQIEFVENFGVIDIIVFWHHERHSIFFFVDFDLFDKTGSFFVYTDLKLNITFL
jgi:hypothetical protein